MRREKGPQETVAYLRVSTLDQDLEKNKADILKLANVRNLGKVSFREEKVSGTKNWKDRKIGTIITDLGNGDRIIVSELSRLGRSMLEIMEILSVAKEKGIEVFAVKPEHADIDLSDELVDSITDSGCVMITMLRGQNLPVGATAFVYYDRGTGQIDYEDPLNETPIRIWPTWQDKAGFGMSEFGLSDFGYDSAAAVGFGKGCFGKDQFGLGADTIQWISPPLATGVYKFAIKIIDKVGNESSIVETEPVTVTPTPRPAEKLEIVSYNKQQNQLFLEISSP